MVRIRIQKAGALLVSVDATASALGPVTSITNTGTLGGVFLATGLDTERPEVGVVGGTKGMKFDGTDFLQLADVPGPLHVLIPPPAGIVGESPTRSIEAWALNPEVANEETLVSWGKRGGPDGSNVSFGYGSDFRWGAMGHWGGDGPDLGWNNDGGNPPPNKWLHLVYTFDGTTSRVYSDGALANAELVREGVINTHPDTSINLGIQLDADGTTPTGGLRFSGTIARVRIHDEVLTPAQILANYTLEKPDFIDLTTPPPAPIQSVPLVKGPSHRYSFGDAASANATDKEFKDSVGTAHGTVRGDGASLSGNRLVLAGGPSATSAYGDLPNGLISANSTNKGGSGAVTLETWMKVTGARTWSRVFDIGSSTQDPDNEVTGPGGGGTGLDYLALTAQIGDDTGSRRLELRNEDPAGGRYGDLGFGNANLWPRLPSRRDTLASVATADNGAAFVVKVSNGTGATTTTVTSAPAVLTLAVDTVTLKHRYSFNETSGTSVQDSVVSLPIFRMRMIPPCSARRVQLRLAKSFT